MIAIGKYNTLRIAESTEFGLRLEDETGEDVLLPNRYTEETMQIDDEIEVFVYTDSEDRIIATTEKPLATAGEFSFLEVKDVTNIGAFIDIGLTKDILVPFSNQDKRLTPGEKYIFYVYLDQTTERMVASSRYLKYLSKETSDLNDGEEVEVVIAEEHELGYQVIVNGKYQGLIYDNEIFKNINPGEKHIGHIKQVRQDGKLDITLGKIGYQKVEPNAQLILTYLQENEGFVPLTDKSAPEEISKIFPVSKKTFKKAVGALYKARMIELKEDGLYLK